MIVASALVYALGALGLLVFGVGFVVGIVTAVLAHERAELERQERIMRALEEEDRIAAGELPEMMHREFRGARP